MNSIHNVPRKRDFDAERRERDSFVVLLHLYTLKEQPAGFPPRRIARELGFTPGSAEEISERLVGGGFLEHPPGSTRIHIGARGSEYVERFAGRRRSLRA